MIKFEKVNKSFGSTRIIKNLSFELNKGDITGLLGPNGAGKTTTMRMLVSYYSPETGKIIINGKNTSKDTIETQKNIGYLPENNPLYIDMLVADYLEMSAKLYGVKTSEIRERILEVADEVDIKNKLAKPIKELSKGYKQRVGLAAALIHNPQILILDEPTEGLDPNQRQELHKLINKISKDKIILISTHVIQEVKAMCNNVLLINDGELIKFGKPEDLTKNKAINIKLSGKNIEKELKEFIKDNDLEKSSKVKVHKDETADATISSDTEIRPSLSELIAKNKWTVWNLQIEDSIEQVFKDLKEKHED
jgi:ABC-2 type transport system ATP-binding protein